MFQPGQRLEIVEGAFAGLHGVVITPEEVVRLSPGMSVPPPATDEVWMAIRIFGRDVPVALPPWSVLSEE